MKCGKLTESVYERSVIKGMKANGAGLGADCAVLAGNGDSPLRAQLSVSRVLQNL